ncbi:hypothetical protein D3C85_1516500 [compost metagenome]
MVSETCAIECNLLDTGSLGLFSNTLADQGCRGGVATLARTAERRAHFGFGSGSTGQHRGAVAGDHAGVDVEVRAVHAQTRHALLGNADAGLTCTTETLLFLGQHIAAPYFFLVSLIVIFSSA